MRYFTYEPSHDAATPCRFKARPLNIMALRDYRLLPLTLLATPALLFHFILSSSGGRDKLAISHYRRAAFQAFDAPMLF